MHIFSYFILPLSCLALNLWTWRLVYSNDWNQVLPLLCRYIGFNCVCSILLMPLVYWSWYPVRIQQSICLAYLHSWQVVEIATLGFLIAVIYELLAYTARNRSEGRRLAIRIVIYGLVVFGLLLALISVPCFQSHSCSLAQLLAAIPRSMMLVIIGLIMALLVLKRRVTVRWDRGISLFVLGPALYFPAQIVLAVAYYNSGRVTPLFELASYLSPFLWVLIWWMASRTRPDLGSAAKAALLTVN
jgi:hypothetical protein